MGPIFRGELALVDCGLDLNHCLAMPLHPAAQQLIRKVEDFSGRLVHVTEDPDLQVMATIRTARGGAPAHFLRYRPGTQAVDYLVAYQLVFLVRLFSCPEGQRWEVSATEEERQVGIKALGLNAMGQDFAAGMVDHLVIQLRTYSVGVRVDDWIWKNLPELWSQQEHSIRTQLAENMQSLAPEIRQRFPKPLLDANTAMNAAYATAWGEVLGEPQFVIPFKALGYAGKAEELLEILKEVPDDPQADRELIERWAKCLGLDGSFHFTPHSFS